jgi:hypothetical protein
MLLQKMVVLPAPEKGMYLIWHHRCWFRVVAIDRLDRGNIQWCCRGNASSLSAWVWCAMRAFGSDAIGNDGEHAEMRLQS